MTWHTFQGKLFFQDDEIFYKLFISKSTFLPTMLEIRQKILMTNRVGSKTFDNCLLFQFSYKNPSWKYISENDTLNSRHDIRSCPSKRPSSDGRRTFLILRPFPIHRLIHSRRVEIPLGPLWITILISIIVRR